MTEVLIAWLRENGLALYGAITGSAALLITYFGYRHNVAKDAIKLAVSHSPHPNAVENLKRIQSVEGLSFDQANLVEVHLVTVRNLGSIPAPLDDVGIIATDGEKRHSLVPRRLSDPMLLGRVSEAKLQPLGPRSAQSFSVYLKRGEPVFSVVKAYAVDQTGKVWSSNA